MYQPLSQKASVDQPASASVYSAPSVHPAPARCNAEQTPSSLCTPLMPAPPAYMPPEPQNTSQNLADPGVQYLAAPALSTWSNYQVASTFVGPPPNYSAPHDFFMLALVTTIICAILNLLSLGFGIPAIVLSAISMNAKNNKDYPKAKDWGKYSLLLTTINIIFTLLFALLIIGLTVGLYGRCAYYGYYC